MGIYFFGKTQRSKYRQLIAEERAKDAAAARLTCHDRRRWALALADILFIRNQLPHNVTTLDLQLSEVKRQQLSEQLLKELGIADNASDEYRREHVERSLRLWISGVGQAPAAFYEEMATRGQVRDAIAFDCMRTAFLVRCMAGLGWCNHNDAWLILLLNAQRAQDSFVSWQDYGAAYARARHIWLELMQTPPQMMDRAALEIKEYLARQDNNWNRCPWQEYKIFVLEQQ
ncbi:hypothetical protein Z042_12475 [Chania multitudinisentens RB-25]|uniref:DUF1266 domain-containing protein n=1 Tax=Chania multitudinisentens RB-25 TaxID=1441930 RepID=W0L9C0_9GAMM|nr:hypothetical protein Z042_12475 [Chania multitudinisentens RB-25]